MCIIDRVSLFYRFLGFERELVFNVSGTNRDFIDSERLY